MKHPTTSGMWRAPGLAVIGMFAASCQSGADAPALPYGPAAYDVIPVATATAGIRAAELSPGDVLSVRVLQEPDLSLDEITVSPEGFIQLPLIGEIRAEGRTAAEVKQQITAALGQTYLRDPNVAVNIISQTERTITVEGEVETPGIFAIRRDTTLLGALALAQSPTQFAKRDEIFVFRNVDGQRMGARFELGSLRSGQAPNPQILPGDIIVVGYSTGQSCGTAKVPETRPLPVCSTLPVTLDDPCALPSMLEMPVRKSITSRPPFSVSLPRRRRTSPASVMIRRLKS